MSFAMLCLDGEMFIFALLGLGLLGVVCVGFLVAAIYTTIGLAKWAAARHNRMVANQR